MLMVRQHFHRLTTALVVVLSVLFAQLALGSYVCPQQAAPAAMAAMMEAGIPCDGMDPEQPGLCHQHAADQGKSFEAVKLPHVSLPAVIQVLELPPLLDAEADQAILSATVPEAYPPPDPLFLSTLRLRV